DPSFRFRRPARRQPDARRLPKSGRLHQLGQYRAARRRCRRGRGAGGRRGVGQTAPLLRQPRLLPLAAPLRLWRRVRRRVWRRRVRRRLWPPLSRLV
ncbi:MAG: hypothetical protein AVDCRST_MAG27-1557, partial [uncultured Craurococcus sp.]